MDWLKRGEKIKSRHYVCMVLAIRIQISVSCFDRFSINSIDCQLIGISSLLALISFTTKQLIHPKIQSKWNSSLFSPSSLHAPPLQHWDNSDLQIFRHVSSKMIAKSTQTVHGATSKFFDINTLWNSIFKIRTTHNNYSLSCSFMKPACKSITASPNNNEDNWKMFPELKVHQSQFRDHTHNWDQMVNN